MENGLTFCYIFYRKHPPPLSKKTEELCYVQGSHMMQYINHLDVRI